MIVKKMIYISFLFINHEMTAIAWFHSLFNPYYTNNSLPKCPAENHYGVVTIPKCGTHLMLQILGIISGINRHIGVKRWCLIDDTTMRNFFEKPALLKTHALYNNENIKKINHEHCKIFFVYRDPRDQIISAAFWIKKMRSEWPNHYTWNLNSLIDELIIDGGSVWGTIFSSPETWQNLGGINSFYNLYLPWRYEPYIYTTTFEKLIGPQGGGDKDAQLYEIIAIARHMGIQINQKQATQIANRVFGGGVTFREGKIGSWKKYFLERHKIAFKKVAGQLLIDLGYEKDLNW